MSLKSTVQMLPVIFLILFHNHNFEVKSVQEETRTLFLELKEHLKDHMVHWLSE